MKKGVAVPLEALVKMTPHLIATIALLVVIGLFVYYALLPELSEPQRDFKRLVKNFENLLKAPVVKLSTSVPMSAKASYNVVVYSSDSPVLPTRCRRQSCICVVEVVEGKPFETCKAYPDIKTCNPDAACGRALCFAEDKTIQVTAGKPIAISVSKDCNTVSIG